MRIRRLLASAVMLLAGFDASVSSVPAMTDVGAEPEAVRLADLPGSHELANMKIWNRVVEMGGLEGFSERALTMFVPSDAAFESLSPEELTKLLGPDQRDQRRAFLARSAAETRISPTQVAGKRLTIATLDGKPLTIDATAGEVVVGDAEAIAVLVLHDGRVIFVLDQASIKGVDLAD
jgi:hypothetical protein